MATFTRVCEKLKESLNSRYVPLITCTVQPANSNDTSQETFLYQEQVISTQLDQPYRQRFFQVASSGDYPGGRTASHRGSVQSTSYRPLTPHAGMACVIAPLKRR